MRIQGDETSREAWSPPEQRGYSLQEARVEDMTAVTGTYRQSRQEGFQESAKSCVACCGQ